jgi:hypothetical protein
MKARSSVITPREWQTLLGTVGNSNAIRPTQSEKQSMKQYLCFAAAIVFLGLATVTHARPQIWTNSIGWIDPSDIECPETSDHTCTVKDLSDREPLAYVYTNQSGNSFRYRIRAGTEIKVVNDGIHNEPTFDSE